MEERKGRGRGSRGSSYISFCPYFKALMRGNRTDVHSAFSVPVETSVEPSAESPTAVFRRFHYAGPPRVVLPSNGGNQLVVFPLPLPPLLLLPWQFCETTCLIYGITRFTSHLLAPVESTSVVFLLFTRLILLARSTLLRKNRPDPFSALNFTVPVEYAIILLLSLLLLFLKGTRVSRTNFIAPARTLNRQLHSHPRLPPPPPPPLLPRW